MQIIPGLEDPYNESFRPLHTALLALQDDFRSREVDLILVISPHGMSLQNALTISMNNKFRGLLPKLTRSNVDGKEIVDILEFPGDKVFAEKIFSHLRQTGIECKS